MAEHENLAAVDDMNNPDLFPKNLAQSIVDDRDLLASISAAIFDYLAPQLKHVEDNSGATYNCWVFCPNR